MATLKTTVTPQGVMTQGTIEIVLDKSNNRITVDSMFNDNGGYLLDNIRSHSIRDVLECGGRLLGDQVCKDFPLKDGHCMWSASRKGIGSKHRLIYRYPSLVTVESDERYVRINIKYDYWQEKGKWYFSSNALLGCEKVRLDSIVYTDRTTIPVTKENVHQAALYALGDDLAISQPLHPDIFWVWVDKKYSVILRCNKLIRYEILTALEESGFARKYANLEWTDYDKWTGYDIGPDDTRSRRTTMIHLDKGGYEVLHRYVEYFHNNGVDDYSLNVDVVEPMML